MKFFTAVKQAIFAAKAFAAAGIDFEKVSEAGDENVIKAHVDAAIADAIAKGEGAHEKLFEQAKAENDKLSALVANHAKAFEAIGVKVQDVSDATGTISTEKLKAVHDQIVTKATRQMLSASGQPPIPEAPSADATKGGKKSASYAEFSAMSPKAKKEFLRAGGEIHDGPKL